jgi:hypothetical protein
MSTMTSPPADRESAAVLALLAGLQHPHKGGIEALRRQILALDAHISEDVKWNAPSFKLTDHFATFRLHPPKHIQLILHTGAKVKRPAKAFTIDDPAGLLQWPAPDRAVLTLASDAELHLHMDQVVQLIRQWMAQL